MVHVAAAIGEPRPMISEERKVIFASSPGTVFQWYDLLPRGSRSAVIAAATRVTGPLFAREATDSDIHAKD